MSFHHLRFRIVIIVGKHSLQGRFMNNLMALGVKEVQIRCTMSADLTGEEDQICIE